MLKIQRFVNDVLDKDRRIASGVIRMVMGVLSFWCIWVFDRDYVKYIDNVDFSKYDPIGVLQFLFVSSPPSGIFLNGLVVFGYGASILMVLGVFSRLSTIAAVISGWMLASLQYSWGVPWSHGYNVVYLALFSTMFLPVGQSLSLDALLFPKMTRKIYRSTRNNGWAVFMAVGLVSLMYFNAFFYKITTGRGLNWALTDSLRNYVIERYLIYYHTDIPSHLQWIVDNEWAWKGLALGNLFVQGVAIFGILYFHRPWLKLIIGLLFMIETLGLGVVMDLWNFKWLLIFVFYVDWDFFLKRYSPRLQRIQSKSFLPTTGKIRSRYLVITAIVLVFQVAVAFDTGRKVERKLKPYPFSSFPMFKTVNCKKPYDQHLPLYFRGNQFDFLGADLNDEVMDELQAGAVHTSRYYYRRDIYDTTLVKKIIAGQLKQFTKQVSTKEEISVRWNRDLVVCPPYPNPAKLVSVQRGLIAKIDAKGHVKTVKLLPRGTSPDDFYLEIRTVGYDSLSIKNIVAYSGLDHSGPMEVDFEIYGKNKIRVNNLRDQLVQLAITIHEPQNGHEETYFTGRFEILTSGSIYRDRLPD